MNNSANNIRSMIENAIATQKSGDKLDADFLEKLLLDFDNYQQKADLQTDELNNARIELEKAQKQFTDLFNNAPYAIFMADEKGNYLQVNPTACKMTGYEEAELLKMNIKDLTPERAHKKAVEHFGDIKQHVHSRVDRPFLTKQGQERWSRIDSIKLNDGTTLGFKEDITDRKIMDWALKERMKELKSIFTITKILEDTTRPLHAVLQEIVEVIPAAMQFPKLTCVSICLDDKEFKTANFAECSWKIQKNVSVFSKVIGKITIAYTVKSESIGSSIFLAEEVNLLGEIAERISSFIEQKNAQKQIKKLSKAVEQNPTTIVITDTKGTIEYVNPRFTELTGYSYEEAIGQNPHIMQSGKTKRAVYIDLWTTILAGKVWRGEFVNKKKSREEFIENSIIAPIFNDDGVIINFVAIKEDVTVRKQHEEVIRRNNHKIMEYASTLKELNSTKDKFFNIIAHDLRNPFTSIMGFSEILVDNYAKMNDEKIIKYLETIYTAAKSAHKLLENLLEWSRSQTGNIEFKPQTIDLPSKFDEINSITEGLCNKKDISLSFDPNDCKEVIADSNMLSTILRNLITNAIKFTPQGGKIKVKAELSTDSTIISVSDTGIGMNSDILGKLFKISEKITRNGTDNERGTGLGLLLCKEFVTKHGGEIWVRSTEDIGSLFSFSLPVKLMSNNDKMR